MFKRLAATVATALLLSSAPLAAAEDDLARLGEALHLDAVFSVMREEGLAYGDEIGADLLRSPAGAAWQAEVARIYAVDRVLPMFVAAFEDRLSGNADALPEMLAFFTSDLGRRVTLLELSARRALLDDGVEEASRLGYDRLRIDNDPRLALVDDFVVANDLVEANVSGAMNANLAFFRGLGEAGVLGPEMGEAEVLAQVWSQEDDIRAETEEWVYSYLVMAYAPLGEEELRAYTAFSRTEAGRALNRALFAAFDVVFVDVSHQLGRAAGGELKGQDL